MMCSPPTFLIRRVAPCHNCQKRRRFVVTDAVWYGATYTCCACGDSWTEGERHPRPFRKGWRKEAIARARKKWAEAGPYNRDAHRAWVRAQVEDLSLVLVPKDVKVTEAGQ